MAEHRMYRSTFYCSPHITEPVDIPYFYVSGFLVFFELELYLAKILRCAKLIPNRVLPSGAPAVEENGHGLID